MGTCFPTCTMPNHSRRVAVIMAEPSSSTSAPKPATFAELSNLLASAPHWLLFLASRFHLSVSRCHSQLRLVAETVSRVLIRFRAQKLIQIEGRELELLDPKGLRTICQALLPE